MSSQNKRLSEYQRRDSWLQIDPCSPEAERQACNSQSWKARGCYNLDPRDYIFQQTVSKLSVANHVFLGSWTVDICQECHSLRSASQRRHMAQVRWCSHSTPRKPSNWDQGGNWDVHLSWSSVLAENPVAWGAWTWEGHKTHSPSGSVPLQSTENLSGLEVGRSWNAGSTWESALAEYHGVWAV